MEKATIAKFKDNLSAYLRKVRSGQTVVIYDRDVPIASVERIEASTRGSDRLALLRAQGVTRPPARSHSMRQLRSLLARPLPRRADLAGALREDRDTNR